MEPELLDTPDSCCFPPDLECVGSKTFEIGVQRARFGLSELRSNTDRERGWEYAFRATRLIPTAGSITGVSRYGGQIP